MNITIEKNKKMFADFKALNLPLGQYAITSSGALGIRNLREMGDIDIIVDRALWDDLAQTFGVVQENHVKKIVLAGGLVEVLGEESFQQQNASNPDHSLPTIFERIAAADIIDGLAFESLEHVIVFKKLMGREKDLKDILLIEAWKKNQQSRR